MDASRVQLKDPIAEFLGLDACRVNLLDLHSNAVFRRPLHQLQLVRAANKSGSNGFTRIIFTTETTENTEEERLALLTWMRLASICWIRFLQSQSPSFLERLQVAVLTATPKVFVQDKTPSWPLKARHPQLYEPISPKLLSIPSFRFASC